MNDTVFEGKYKQDQGEAKSWWGKLPQDDLDGAAGKFDVFNGLRQEKYGYTHEAAADEIDKRVTEYGQLEKGNRFCPQLNQQNVITIPYPFRMGMGQLSITGNRELKTLKKENRI